MEYDAKIMATEGGYSLVSWEGRKFPGLTIQGDSLHILLEVLQEAAEALRNGPIEDVESSLGEAIEIVGSMVAAYEFMMASRGKELPYRNI